MTPVCFKEVQTMKSQWASSQTIGISKKKSIKLSEFSSACNRALTSNFGKTFLLIHPCYKHYPIIENVRHWIRCQICIQLKMKIKVHLETLTAKWRFQTLWQTRCTILCISCWESIISKNGISATDILSRNNEPQ